MYTLRHYLKNLDIFIIFILLILLKECPIEIKNVFYYFKIYNNIPAEASLRPNIFIIIM